MESIQNQISELKITEEQEWQKLDDDTKILVFVRKEWQVLKDTNVLKDPLFESKVSDRM
jgi:hypothetical protein